MMTGCQCRGRTFHGESGICKGPEVGMNIVYSRHRKVNCEGGAWSKGGSEAG